MLVLDGVLALAPLYLMFGMVSSATQVYIVE